MSTPSLVFKIGFVQSERRLNTPRLYAQYGGKRSFYSCNQDFNYVSYVNKGSKEKLDYVAYSGDGEKSMGVFDSGGLMDAKAQARLKEKLRTTDSVIWHGFIAFEQAFGNRYMGDIDDAIRLLNTEFPKLFKSAGLKPENITWYAGLHENTQKRHIHFSFFENAPSRYSERGGRVLQFSEGHIPKPVIDRFKIAVEQRLTDVASELKPARRNLTDIAKEVLLSEKNVKRNLTEVQEHITALIPLLPPEGRLAYESNNMEPLRPRIRRIADLLIKSNPRVYRAFTDLCDAAVRRDDRIRDMLSRQKVEEKYWDGYMTTGKVLDDTYRRLGNYIINTARVFRNKEKPGGRAARNRLVRKRYKKQATASVMTYCLSLSVSVEDEAMKAFEEYMRKLKKAKAENETGELEKEEYEMD